MRLVAAGCPAAARSHRAITLRRRCMATIVRASGEEAAAPKLGRTNAATRPDARSSPFHELNLQEAIQGVRIVAFMGAPGPEN
jgi:hypothetical protein